MAPPALFSYAAATLLLWMSFEAGLCAQVCDLQRGPYIGGENQTTVGREKKVVRFSMVR